MAITTTSHVTDALANNNTPYVLDKATVPAQVVGQYTSLWRATGLPAQGAIPAAAALCTKALLGSVQFTNQTLPAKSYLGQHTLLCSVANTNYELADRLAHMGGLNGTLLTAQTVGLDLATLAVPADRLGAANYGEVLWFLEWYTTTGATASNATVNVTYDDASTGNLALIAVGGSIAASQMRQLVSAVNGRTIKGVNNVTLSASTATAGSFGVTAYRQRAGFSAPIANKLEVFDWAQTALPHIPNDACLCGILISTATTTGTFKGLGKIVYG